MSDKKPEGWDSTPKRRREAATTPRMEVIEVKEHKKFFSLALPASRHERIALIIKKLPGGYSMNSYINDAIEAKLREDEDVAEKLSAEMEQLRKEQK